MSYEYKKRDPREAFKNWLDFQSDYILLAVERGYTESQAIELLKVWHLAMLGDTVSGLS